MTFAVRAQQALTIIEQDYALAMRTAAQQQKLLIVDFYTTWCVPCKVLDKTIFKNDSIAGQISKNFVALRYDAERDTVHHLTLKHHVSSYPTTAILTADGRLIQKMFGFGEGESLAASYSHLLQESISLNEQGTYIAGFPPAIEPDKYPDFYKKYVRGIANIKPSDLANYWMNNPDLESEVSFAILAYFGRAPRHVVDSFIQHKQRYEARFGTADVKFVMNNITSEKFNEAVKEKDEAKYDAALKFAREHMSARNVEKYVSAYNLEMFMATGKWDQAISTVEERIKMKAISDNGINNFCWNVFESCSEKKIIEAAIQLMKGIVDLNPSFATLDTYARLLAKNGNKGEAKTAMKRAIDIGKANGEDTKESEEALGSF